MILIKHRIKSVWKACANKSQTSLVRLLIRITLLAHINCFVRGAPFMSHQVVSSGQFYSTHTKHRLLPCVSLLGSSNCFCGVPIQIADSSYGQMSSGVDWSVEISLAGNYEVVLIGKVGLLWSGFWMTGIVLGPERPVS